MMKSPFKERQKPITDIVEDMSNFLPRSDILAET